MKTMLRSCALLLALALASTTSFAAENLSVPGQVQFSGSIFTTEDAEVHRGVTFALFAEQTGGAAAVDGSELLMSLQRQMDTQVSKAVSSE